MQLDEVTHYREPYTAPELERLVAALSCSGSCSASCSKMSHVEYMWQLRGLDAHSGVLNPHDDHTLLST